MEVGVSGDLFELARKFVVGETRVRDLEAKLAPIKAELAEARKELDAVRSQMVRFQHGDADGRMEDTGEDEEAAKSKKLIALAYLQEHPGPDGWLSLLELTRAQFPTLPTDSVEFRKQRERMAARMHDLKNGGQVEPHPTVKGKYRALTNVKPGGDSPPPG